MSRPHPFAKAERDGAEAFRAGVPIEANPYVGKVHSRTSKGWNLHREQAWRGGWDRARFGRPLKFAIEVKPDHDANECGAAVGGPCLAHQAANVGGATDE